MFIVWVIFFFPGGKEIFFLVVQACFHPVYDWKLGENISQTEVFYAASHISNFISASTRDNCDTKFCFWKFFYMCNFHTVGLIYASFRERKKEITNRHYNALLIWSLDTWSVEKSGSKKLQLNFYSSGVTFPLRPGVKTSVCMSPFLKF